jgi:hypothetical protein
VASNCGIFSIAYSASHQHPGLQLLVAPMHLCLAAYDCLVVQVRHQSARG